MLLLRTWPSFDAFFYYFFSGSLWISTFFDSVIHFYWCCYRCALDRRPLSLVSTTRRSTTDKDIILLSSFSASTISSSPPIQEAGFSSFDTIVPFTELRLPSLHGRYTTESIITRNLPRYCNHHETRKSSAGPILIVP